MSIFTERLSKLEKSEEFANWLWEGLSEFYLGTDKPLQGRSELYNLFLTSGREYPIEVMTRIYSDYIPEYKQQSFKQSIGIALSKCVGVKDEKVFSIVDDLTYLIGQTQETEALDNLLEIASNEYIAKKHSEILYHTLSNVPLLNLDDKVFDFTRKLVNSQYFDNGYIFSTMELMMDYKPNDSLKIIDEYAIRIKELYSAARGIKEEELAYWDAASELFDKYPEVQDKIYTLSK